MATVTDAQPQLRSFNLGFGLHRIVCLFPHKTIKERVASLEGQKSQRMLLSLSPVSTLKLNLVPHKSRPRALKGKSSDIASHGTGPQATAKARLYRTKHRMDNQDILEASTE
ncbi:hypothetical protein P5673_032425 [Acropora cervicornis]|uniref:Uncharacterized protein n=1 Tax=Acropora cervicornis TaxID=6130 RepID=A0AAD9PR90_ACRCE|nr:hypothetical protein P5673_032425 [Acropora cervicornis]